MLNIEYRIQNTEFRTEQSDFIAFPDLSGSKASNSESINEISC